MDVQKCSLVASGPFCLTREPNVFSAEEGRHAGIYLWTVETTHGELVGYVGETGKSFAGRMREHLRMYLCGEYNIYESDALRRGELRLLWSGIRVGNDLRRYSEFLARLPNLLPEIRAYIDLTRFWLFPCDLERRSRCRIEGAIARHLYDQPVPVGGFQERLRYQSRGEEETPILVNFELAGHLVGFPSTLEA